MPFQHVLTRLQDPWFCTPGAYQAMTEIVDACMARFKAGGDALPKMEGINLHDMQARRPMTIDQDRIAHIHVFGTMGRNLSPLENMCGRTDYAVLEREMAQAAEQARGALFEFDTPGGQAVGIDQTAKKMASMPIPAAGYTDTVCASGGMYLAAGLPKMFAASGSLLGSIGAMLPWDDTSKMSGLLGIQPRTFTNEGAIFKGLRPNVPLTDEQAGHLQNFADALGSQFRAHVEDYRSVNPEVFKAGSYMAPQAIEYGLADEVGGRAEALNYLLTKLRG